MSSDSEPAAQRPEPNGVHVPADDVVIEQPATPEDMDSGPPPSSQLTLPSTEVPASPIDDVDGSFKSEHDERPNGIAAVIPSSLTPPPSSQVPSHNGNGAIALQQPAFVGSQRSNLFSPPATTLNALRRDAALSTSTSEYVAPTARQVLDASADELRAMMQNAIAEHAKLKMEAAHHKLQYNLLSLQADEDAKRAAVEHEMTRREVEALRMAEHSRQARRELSTAVDSFQSKYLQLKAWYDAALDENDALARRVKLAKKVIQQKDEEVVSLTDERDMLLNRIRENREHFRILRSPGGIFHDALTPKQQTVSTPQQFRGTPRQTPRAAAASSTAHREVRHDRDQGGGSQEPFAALLQVLSQENNSAPSTPTTAHRPAPRLPSKHTRNVQSLSSLPTTPTSRPPRGELLPSVDLVPQTEPARRYSSQRFGGGVGRATSPLGHRTGGRRSRESTISADDDDDLARQARVLESVAQQAASFMSSQASRASRSGSHHHRSAGTAGDEEEDEVFESQASQAASEMLRRDPRESFEVASSVGSRDGTPAPAEKTATLHAKLFSGLAKTEKRKFSGGSGAEDSRRELMASPTKKMRVGAALGENANRVGLGIVNSSSQ